MLKFLKELFLGKPAEPVQDYADIAIAQRTPVPAGDVVDQPVLVQPAPVVVEEVQSVAEVKADPVSVALDLEPMDFASATTPVAEKKPRKPRAPKTASTAPVKKTDAKKPAATKAPAKRGPKKTK